MHGGTSLTQKYVYKVFANPLYIGKVTHTRDGKTSVFNGLHQPIIDKVTWKNAHDLISTMNRNTLHRWTHPHLLKGKLRTRDGFAISPTSTRRPLSKKGSTEPGSRLKRLVRYYVSQKAIKHGFNTCPIKSINAEHLDDLVRSVVLDHLDHPPLKQQPTEIQDHWVRRVIDRVVLSVDKLVIDLDASKIDVIRQYKFGDTTNPAPAQPTCPHRPDLEDRGRTVRLILNTQIKKLDGRRLILSPEGHDLVIPSTPEPQQHIVDAIGLAYRWHDELLKNHETFTALARRYGVTGPIVHRRLRLIQLSPVVLCKSLNGTLALNTTLEDLTEAAKHLDWDHQAQYLGLDSLARSC